MSKLYKWEEQTPGMGNKILYRTEDQFEIDTGRRLCLLIQLTLTLRPAS